ncbi:cyclase [Penicillium fimorum]|uniref:Cyclase n=1 Tax=Penicillium fimorum TaxID=1882269 RepID=A0A9X0CAW3_9EURO|nr:cyclase [Penicillium fimorum]
MGPNYGEVSRHILRVHQDSPNFIIGLIYVGIHISPKVATLDAAIDPLPYQVALKIPCLPLKLPTNCPRIPKTPSSLYGKIFQRYPLGRLYLLTPQRVKASAAEIETGEMIRLDLPLTEPEQPALGREVFQHNIKTLTDSVACDDTYIMNTHSGTQWDGLRPFAHIESKSFYNGATSSDFVGEAANHCCSVHHYAMHGIAG